jgi:hypothetical protein
MDRKPAVRRSEAKIEAALAALRTMRGDAVVSERRWTEAAQAAYAGEVQARMVELFGVKAPAWAERLIVQAGLQAFTSERCAAFIGEVFDLRPLPD